MTMRYQATFLSEMDRERVHEQSLRILDEIGVRFHGERALPLLEDAGARVDRETGIARIPRSLVEVALASAPRSVVLGARDPRHDYPLPSPITRYGLDGTAAFARDFETGERRYGTRLDVELGCRVFGAADMGVLAWPPVAASDMPSASRPLHEFATMLRACAKHGQHELHTREQAPFLAEILRVVFGGEAVLRDRHPASVVYCPVAPLTHDGPMLDAYLDLGDLDVPVMLMPMPIAGSTGPAGLFANVSLANAEALSSIVVFQLAHPGRPTIYSSCVASMDFRTGGFLGGTPEAGIQSAVLTTMGRSYGLPTTSSGCASDAHDIGAEAIIDKLMTMLPPLSAGSSIIVGFGEIDGDQTLVLEQILVDNELAHLCERLYDGMASGPEAGLFDEIASAGPSGDFLVSETTRRAARSGEFYLPELLGRLSREAWLGSGSPSMYDRARERVREIIDAPPADPLPDATAMELDRVLEEADRELGARSAEATARSPAVAMS
jgi:trimethylamine--corrinoid protein Co-methyltransferase